MKSKSKEKKRRFSMAKHTISFPERIEASVREVQILLMLEYKGDVSFTEAVCHLLLEGLSVWVEETELSDDEIEQAYRRWMLDVNESSISGFRDSLQSAKKKYAYMKSVLRQPDGSVPDLTKKNYRPKSDNIR
jgi:hypothetical protein